MAGLRAGGKWAVDCCVVLWGRRLSLFVSWQHLWHLCNQQNHRWKCKCLKLPQNLNSVQKSSHDGRRTPSSLIISRYKFLFIVTLQHKAVKAQFVAPYNYITGSTINVFIKRLNSLSYLSAEGEWGAHSLRSEAAVWWIFVYLWLKISGVNSCGSGGCCLRVISISRRVYGCKDKAQL